MLELAPVELSISMKREVPLSRQAPSCVFVITVRVTEVDGAVSSFCPLRTPLRFGLLDEQDEAKSCSQLESKASHALSTSCWEMSIPNWSLSETSSRSSFKYHTSLKLVCSLSFRVSLHSSISVIFQPIKPPIEADCGWGNAHSCTSNYHYDWSGIDWDRSTQRM